MSHLAFMHRVGKNNFANTDEMLRAASGMEHIIEGHLG